MSGRNGAWRLVIGASLAAAAPGFPAQAAERGVYTYFSADSCAAGKKASKEICSNAARNAAAEFEEKAPHYPTRAACEQAWRAGGCALSFRQAGRTGVSFTPRQQGFRLAVRSGSDITTTPLAPGLAFSARTALRLAVGVDPRAAGAAAPRAVSAGGRGFGASEPTGPRGELPPPVPVDPNFDCAKYIEPSAKGDIGAACAPAPVRRR